VGIVGWVEERNPTNQRDIYKCDRIALPTGDRIALPTGARERLATWRLSVGETGESISGLKAKVGLKPTNFVVGIVGWVEERNPTNQRDIYKCDCIALPTGDRIALPTGARERLATWRLSVGETGESISGLKAKVGLKPTNFVVGIVGWVEERNPTNQRDIYKCDRI
ncbi:hypothetical protein, partial [Cylindrospermopsis raciborskii]|uniref:hypothetical protein n=1 Tax=Cylindrospermopsis raciborskii TaxID=77022 RepID=UPI001CA5870E